MAIKLTDKLTAITADKVIVDANQVAGGYMAITSAERAELTDALKVDGVTVYETDTKKTYKYINNNWVQEDQETASGTYSSVTVNSRGRVTGGSNPTIPIDKGGTGSTTRKDAMTQLITLGTNPNGSIENDTVEFWKSQGTGIAWYQDIGLIHGQPSQYGFLLNLIVNGDIWQFWKRQQSGNKGELYHRTGNFINGLPTTWVKVIDSNNIGSQSVAEATKATKDGDGNVITEKYVPKQDGPWPNTLFVYSNMDFIKYTDPANGVTTNYPLVQVTEEEPTPMTIPLRAKGSGAVRVGEPVNDSDATTKKYVDTNISSTMDLIAIQNRWNLTTEDYLSDLHKFKQDQLTWNYNTEDFVQGLSDRFLQYYTKTEINNMELITLEDIDEICGSSVYDGTVVIS